ncbi:MAG: hypothetical protein J7641_02855 [Cyanobacteria bacterium SID2]|nr:hypothetical protein [Cyanobacteria bacterium SID2]MBP0003877.1 hypothetical protein [Cyanobacteria bacterium SBC]
MSLRILAVGDSLTTGFTRNAPAPAPRDRFTGGYRELLENILENELGITPDFFGRFKNPPPAYQAYPGLFLEQLNELFNGGQVVVDNGQVTLKGWLDDLTTFQDTNEPNAILLMAGTNNLLPDDRFPKAVDSARLGTATQQAAVLVELSLLSQTSPDTNIFVATIPYMRTQDPAKQDDFNQVIGDPNDFTPVFVEDVGGSQVFFNSYNSELQSIASQEPTRVHLVDINRLFRVGELNVNTDLPDGVHPSDDKRVYQKFAEEWALEIGSVYDVFEVDLELTPNSLSGSFAEVDFELTQNSLDQSFAFDAIDAGFLAPQEEFDSISYAKLILDLEVQSAGVDDDAITIADRDSEGENTDIAYGNEQISRLTVGQREKLVFDLTEIGTSQGGTTDLTSELKDGKFEVVYADRDAIVHSARLVINGEIAVQADEGEGEGYDLHQQWGNPGTGDLLLDGGSSDAEAAPSLEVLATFDTETSHFQPSHYEEASAWARSNGIPLALADEMSNSEASMANEMLADTVFS